MTAGTIAAGGPYPRASSERSALTRMQLALFGFGLYLPIWSNFPGLGKPFQVAYLVLWAIVLVGALFGSSLQLSRPLPIEVLNLSIGLLSITVAMVLGDGFGLLFSAIFLLSIAEVYLLIRLISLKTLLDIAGYVMMLAVLTCALANISDLVMALSAVLGRHGLFRFQPLNNHPNLTGFIFGGAAIMFARMGVQSRSWLGKALWAGLLGLAVIFVFAASARAALLALAAAGFAATILFRRELRKALPYVVAALAGMALIIVVIGYERIGKYLNKILEFSSNTRGVGSGGTGRFDLWARGIAALTSDTSRMIFGDGLRSSESSSIGFNIESSYISIMLDSGVPLGALFMIFVIYLVFAPLKNASAEESFTWRCFKVLLVYIVFQSTFNRYFLALGNPLSLFALCAVSSAFLMGRSSRQNGSKER